MVYPNVMKIQEERGGKKTVLFVRSSPLHHSLSLLKHLREQKHPNPETRWQVVLQPRVEKEFLEALEGADVDVLRYDRGFFTRRGLEELFGERLSRDRIDAAYVSFNHPAGKGYFQLIRFLSAMGVGQIFIHVAEGHLEAITLKDYVFRRAKDLISDMVEHTLFVILLPFACVYVLFQLAGSKIWPNGEKSEKRLGVSIGFGN